jgi:bifunctional non-homologous end joining protein LigD
VTISNPDKVLWPEAGFTKRDMIDYYVAAAPTLLPHLDGRALTMHRFPDGVDEWHWYQYECRGAPEWLRTADIPYRDGTRRTFCIVDSVDALVWVANLAAIELHTYANRVADPEHPSWIVFDLDPGQSADVADSARVALALRDRLERDGLRGFAKTSGLAGLHVYVPLNGTATFDDAKTYARTIAHALAEEQPARVVARNPKRLRGGKVLVDWLQNDPARSMVAPYSLRGMIFPTVSMPVTWDEVERGEPLVFIARDTVPRIEAHGDLFADVLRLRQSLPRA